MLALITWLGFRQESVEYDKQPRASGQSGWTLARKTKLVLDSIMSFTDRLIRLCSYAGVSLMAVSASVFVAAFLLVPSLGAGLLFLLAVITRTFGPAAAGTRRGW